MILERLSRHIAVSIKTADPEGPGTVEVMEYELGLRLNWYSGLLLTITLGLMFGTTLGALITLFSFALLRKFSGGMHLPITICSIVTGFAAALIPLISLNHEVILMLNIVTLIVVSIYAPNEFEYVNPTRWDKWLKWISIALVIVNFIVMSPEITLAFFIQAILILPVWTKYEGGG
ncbi:accessory gene regulator B family protein [Paenibacillus sp. RRE4]|uniref:accessory gene regulator B family protein n=1 Tax=Paenibacillus sp. RRE4 TaxID=2962587 RepID=UPI0028820BF1|nr:accessory gene regulator B family protein [Paenibacillus sp. RRE4]MDT0123848.1 accessory gene regulator B family protein [Paenibacillus sp. RRE4]